MYIHIRRFGRGNSMGQTQVVCLTRPASTNCQWSSVLVALVTVAMVRTGWSEMEVSRSFRGFQDWLLSSPRMPEKQDTDHVQFPGKNLTWQKKKILQTTWSQVLGHWSEANWLISHNRMYVCYVCMNICTYKASIRWSCCQNVDIRSSLATLKCTDTTAFLWPCLLIVLSTFCTASLLFVNEYRC